MIQKVIIWGHKPYSHTHSWIHYGFYRTFQYLGYDTCWFDNDDDISSFDFTDSIFLTEGQVCSGMPKRKDCKYILHNCPKMDDIGRFVNIQYITNETIKFDKLARGITTRDDAVYFAWGSPLLPHEFNEDNITKKRGDDIYFIGTVHRTKDNGNYYPITSYAKAAKEHSHDMYVGGGYTGRDNNVLLHYLSGWITEEQQEEYLTSAYMAPALQGPNQLSNCMIPCRLFKSISFGNDGISNNPMAYGFFDQSIIYNPDCYQLFFDADSRESEIERRKYVFNLVKENHTYINNIKAIMQLL